jgi:hypothetical protein
MLKPLGLAEGVLGHSPLWCREKDFLLSGFQVERESARGKNGVKMEG